MPAREVGLEAGARRTFNSLFETPYAYAPPEVVAIVGLSILYLRCAHPPPPAAWRSACQPFNSLFEMPGDVSSYVNAVKPAFNSLFEMPGKKGRIRCQTVRCNNFQFSI